MIEIFPFLGSIGQCPNSLENTVIRAGVSLTFSQPTNRDCDWKMMPSNHFYNALLNVSDPTDPTGAKVLAPFVGSLTISKLGITILKAAVTPVGGALWCPAGLYMMQDKEAKCSSSAKVAVIGTSKIIQLISLAT